MDATYDAPIFPKLTQVCFTPSKYWVKYNIHGSSSGFPNLSSCARIYRDLRRSFMSDFAKNIGISNSLYTEVMTYILSIKFYTIRVGLTFG